MLLFFSLDYIIEVDFFFNVFLVNKFDEEFFYCVLDINLNYNLKLVY